MNAASLATFSPDKSALKLYWIIFFCTLILSLLALITDFILLAFLIPFLFILIWIFESPIIGLSIYLLSFSVAFPLFELPVGVHLDDFIFIFIVCIWLGKKIFADERLICFTEINKYVWYFLIFAFFCTLVNFYRYTSRQIIVSSFNYIRLIEYTLPFFITVSLIKSEDVVKKLIWVGMIGAMWVALYGLYQWLFQGVDVIVSSLSPNHLHIGVYVIVVFFLGLGLLYSEKNIPIKVFLLFVLILQVIVLFGSASRAGWLGFLTALLLFTFLKRSKFIFLIACVFLLIYYFFGTIPQTAMQRIATTAQVGYQSIAFDLSTFGRFYIWYGTLKMIFSSLINFFIGVGLGAFWYASFPFVSLPIVPLLKGGATGAHNNFLHVMAELGIIGLIIFLLLFKNIITTTLKNIKRSKTPFQKNLSIGYLSALVGLLVTCFSQETFSVQEASSSFLAFFFFITGLVLYSMFENN